MHGYTLMSLALMISLATSSLMRNTYWSVTTQHSKGSKRSTLSGSGYFYYLSAQQKNIYRRYNNVLMVFSHQSKTTTRQNCLVVVLSLPSCSGVKTPLEGIRTGGQFGCRHPVSRVPAPVPNVQDADGEGWHYHTCISLLWGYVINHTTIKIYMSCRFTSVRLAIFTIHIVAINHIGILKNTIIPNIHCMGNL